MKPELKLGQILNLGSPLKADYVVTKIQVRLDTRGPFLISHLPATEIISRIPSLNSVSPASFSTLISILHLQ